MFFVVVFVARMTLRLISDQAYTDDCLHAFFGLLTGSTGTTKNNQRLTLKKKKNSVEIQGRTLNTQHIRTNQLL